MKPTSPCKFANKRFIRLLKESHPVIPAAPTSHLRFTQRPTLEQQLSRGLESHVTQVFTDKKLDFLLDFYGINIFCWILMGSTCFVWDQHVLFGFLWDQLV